MSAQRLIVSGTALVVISTLAACSSGSSSGAGSSPTGSTSGKSAKPVQVVEIATAQGPVAEGTFARPGAEAAVQAVNAAGGVRGRPLDLTFCDDQAQLSVAAACATKAAADSSVIATVSDNSQNGTAIDPVLNNAHLAAIASIPYTAADFTTPAVFTSEGGGLAIVAGESEFMARMGKTKLAMMVLDTSGGAAAVQFVNAELAALYKKKLTSVLVPATTTDISSSAAAAIRQRPDSVALALPETLEISAIEQLRAQGYAGAIVGPVEALPPAVLKNIPNPGPLYLSGAYAYSSPAYQTFLAEMKKYEPNAQVNDYALSAWVGVHEFADVMSKSTHPLTRAGVLAAFNSASDYSTHGLTPTLDFTKPNPAKGFDRLINMTQVLHQVTSSGTVDVTPVRFLDTLTGQIQQGS